MDLPHRPRPAHRRGFRVAILCVLPVEFDAVEASFEASWDARMYGKSHSDSNTYAFGTLSGHAVVLAVMADMGKVSASTAASGLCSSFPNISLALLVGVCGASPQHPETGSEIMLGDVIISKGIIQSDLGRQFSDGIHMKPSLSDNLSRPNNEIRAHLNMLSGLKASQTLRQNTHAFFAELLEKPDFADARCPGFAHDHLYEANYRHKHRSNPACDVCDKCQDGQDPVCYGALSSSCQELGCSADKLVNRQRPQNSSATQADPLIHLGLVASSDQVMKSAVHRDQIATQKHITGFEMEGAGVWEHLPTIVIKGVCDYADSHKAKRWQAYAGVAAAACARAFLRSWALPEYDSLPPALGDASPSADKTTHYLGALKLTDPREDLRVIKARKNALLDGTSDWVWKDPLFVQWWEQRGSDVFWLHGDAGKGKTMIMVALVNEIQRRVATSGELLVYYFCNSSSNVTDNANAILRGVLYSIFVEHTFLLKHFAKRHDASGEDMFDSLRTIHTLWNILCDVLSDIQAPQIYILVDALLMNAVKV